MDKIDGFDIEELIRGIGGLNDDADIYDYLYDKFNVDFDDFHKIVECLMRHIVVGESPLTKKIYKGFGKDNMFFIKQEVK